MIVASFLLIPVAVLFLALGLINGSSSLLIASIVVSLLAAVALVIGARQAAAARRVAAEPAGPTPAEPFASEPFASEPFDEPVRAGRPDRWDSRPSADDSAPAAAAFAGDSVSYEDQVLADQAGARAAGVRDTAARTGDDRVTVAPGAADHAQSDSMPQTGAESSPDYAQASSTIGAARSAEADDQRWRRPAGDEPVRRPDEDEAVRRPADDEAFRRHAEDEELRRHAEDEALRRQAEADDEALRRPAEPAGETAEAADEFGEPDDDDPDDEPLPQSVRPADAVLIARLDLEVLVVDGRPRYHLADCPHLVGRLTEPLPANEAVELGFSPCGLCRPVDRLVAAVAQR